MQQIMAFETDLLEYDDLFDENPAVERKVAALKDGALAELALIDSMGGAVEAIEYMKSRLVESNAARIGQIESGEMTVVGVNAYQTGEPSPLTAGEDAVMNVDPATEVEQIERLHNWRANRNQEAAQTSLNALRKAALDGSNIMPPSIAAAKAGVTTGEWGDIVRQAFGQYRGPTGVSANPSNRTEGLEDIRESVATVSDKLGRKLKFLMCKPGLDGHSNGAEQIAARARDCGMEISYEGIRFTPDEIVAAAQDKNAHVIGLSILSGSHISLMKDVMSKLEQADLSHIPVVVGGIIPEGDADQLRAMGISRVYTPKDFELNRIMFDIVALADPDEVSGPIAAQ
jgi:(2R)-ethylmalonyl-CoA mutase